MAQEINRLHDLETLKLALVRRGANRKRIAFTKSEDGMDNIEDIMKAVVEGELDDESKLNAFIKQHKISDEGAAAIKGMARLATGFKDELPEGFIGQLAKAMGEKAVHEEDDEYPSPEDKNKALAAAKAKAAKEKAEKEATLKMENLPPEMKQILKHLQDNADAAKSENEELRKNLGEERSKRLEKEYALKAEEFDAVPGDAGELAAILKSLGEKSPELEEKVTGILKASQEMLSSSQMFGSTGRSGSVGNSFSGGGTDDSAWGQIQKAAEGMIEKSGEPITKHSKAEAVAKYLDTEAGQALYEQYLDENPVQRAVS